MVFPESCGSLACPSLSHRGASEVTFATQALRGSELLSLVSLIIQTHVVSRVQWNLGPGIRDQTFRKYDHRKVWKYYALQWNSYYLPFLWKIMKNDHHLQPPGAFIPSILATFIFTKALAWSPWWCQSSGTGASVLQRFNAFSWNIANWVASLRQFKLFRHGGEWEENTKRRVELLAGTVFQQTPVVSELEILVFACSHVERAFQQYVCFTVSMMGNPWDPLWHWCR